MRNKAIVATAIWALTGCSDPSPAVQVVTRRAAELSVEGPGAGTAIGPTYVAAVLRFDAGEAPLARNERVRVVFMSQSGDREEVLGPATSMLVQMEPGHLVEELRSRVDSLGWLLGLRFLQGEGAAVLVDGATTVEQATRVIGLWPAVRSVVPDDNSTTGTVSPAVRIPRSVWIPIGVVSNAVPGDRRLGTTPGFPVRAEYTQPDGSVLRAEFLPR